MAAVAAFSERQPPRSAARLACLRMQHGLLQSALAGRMYLEDSLVTSWLSPLPKLLWELGGSAPHVSAAALVLLLDAARFAAPGSAMATFLSTTLQPQLAPLFAAQLPPKAAKAALAKRAAAAAAAGAAGGTEAGGPQPDASAVLVVLPGVVGKLPENVGYLAADVLYHTGSLGAAVLKPLVAALSSRALPLPLSLRLLDVATARLAADTAGGGADAALAASWLLSVLFGPQHGNTVLSPDGVDLTPEWRQQRAVVDAAVEAVVGRLGGAAGLLQVLAPQLLQLPLTDVGTAGCGAARVQRYSLVRLCGACAAGGDGQGPGELAGVLPRAVALCGLELGVAAAQQQQPQGFAGVGAGGAEVGGSGPVLQLLCECPGLVVPVARCLGELVAGHGGKGAVGSLPMNLAAMAGLRLVQAAVRAQGVRAALVGSRGEVVEAAGGLVRAVRELPAAAGAAAGGALVGGDGTSCVVEAGRLEQMVADLYGAGVAAGGQQ